MDFFLWIFMDFDESKQHRGPEWIGGFTTDSSADSADQGGSPARPRQNRFHRPKVQGRPENESRAWPHGIPQVS